MSEVTSMTLLGQLRTSSKDESWKRFASIYEPLLDGWLRRQGVPQDVTDDVRQEVLLKVYEEIDTFDHNGRPGAFRKWLRGVMANRLRTIQRRRWRDGEGERPDWSDIIDQLGSDDSLLTRRWNEEHDAFLVRKLLELVAAEFQPTSLTAFRRVLLEGHDAAVVATELGISKNAVRIAQSRVLARVRELATGLIDDS